MKIGQNKIIEIKSRIDIVDLISEYISLGKKSGGSFFALCPFHNEKTPSFSINKIKQFYHCFGCGESGDIFSFIEKMEHISFPEAVIKLANRAGVQIDPTDDKEALEASKKVKYERFLLRINELAFEFFKESLVKNKDSIKQFLESRNLDDNSLNNFHIGYAPNSWDNLTRYLFDKKVPLDLAAELGLIRLKPKSIKDSKLPEDYYDSFRHRIVFPIIDPSFKILGFSCRCIVDEENSPKYINSPESIIYKKRESFFGLYQAYREVHSRDQVIIVEGNIDCVTLSNSGLTHVVATLGTALTSAHIQRLKRFSQNIILIFDGDKAGEQAVLRSFDLFAEAGINTVKTLALPDGTDPDSYIKTKGVKNLSDLISKAPFLTDYLINCEIESVDISSPTDKATKFKNCVSIIEKIKDPIIRQAQIKNIEERFKLKTNEKFRFSQKRNLSLSSKNQQNEKTVRTDKAEETLLKILFSYPLMDAPSFKNKILAQDIFSLFTTPDYQIIGKRFIQIFSRLTFENSSDVNITSKNYNTVISEIMITETSNEEFENVKPSLFALLSTPLDLEPEQINICLDDCIKRIESKAQAKIRTQIVSKIKKQEEEAENKEQLQKTINEYQELFKTKDKEIKGGISG